MTRTKGSKNRPKFVQQTFNGLDGTDHTNLMTPNEVRKLEQNEVINTMEIKHVLRVINQGNVIEIEKGGGALKGLNEYFNEGWRLFATHFGGTQPEGMIIIYILIREQ